MSVVDFAQGMNFGKGFSSLRGNTRGDGVSHSPPSEIDQASGQIINFSILRVNSLEDFQSALDIDVKASGRYKFFSASGSFGWSENQKFNNYSEYLVAKVTVDNPLRMIHNVKLTDSASNLLTEGRSDRFQEQFGDYFVQGIQTGAAYYALFEFTSESAEQQRKISAELDAGVTGVFKAGGKFKDELKSITKDTSLRVDSFQIGGPGGTVPTTVDGIIDYAANFPNQVRNTGVPKQALIQDYKTLDLPPSPNFIDIENAKLVLDQFFRLRNMLVTKLNDIDYIQAHPEQFEDVESYDLADARNKVQDWLDSITRTASNCANNPTQCTFVTPAIETITLPKRKEIDPSSLHSFDIAQTLKLTSLKRVGDQDRTLFPEYIRTDTNARGERAYEIYHYIWKEEGANDVEAIVGIFNQEEWLGPGHYDIVVGKMTTLAIKIEFRNKAFIIPESPDPAVAQPGLLRFTLPLL